MLQLGKETVKNSIKKETIFLDPRYLDVKYIKTGDGIDFSTPTKPKVAPYRAFKYEKPDVFDRVKALQYRRLNPANIESLTSGLNELRKNSGLDMSPFTITEMTKFIGVDQEEDEKIALTAYFKGSYGLTSLDASTSVQKSLHEKCQTVYSLLEHSGEAERLEASEKDWIQVDRKYVTDILEKTEKDEEALMLFIRRYGTHYISSIKYGLRIGVQGKVESTESSVGVKVEAAFKTAFGSLSASAGARAEHQKQLSDLKVDLLLEATSGGRKDKGLLSFQGFEKISDFLEKVNTGEIEFTVAPIELVLKSYWPTLDNEWGKMRSILNPYQTKPLDFPDDMYGLPKGSIIAWKPTEEYLEIDGDEIEIICPDGWEICNGENGTPNLVNLFIRGADKDTLDTKGGTTTHTHRILGEGGVVASGRTYTKVTDVSVEENLPPYYSLIYIVKT